MFREIKEMQDNMKEAAYTLLLEAEAMQSIIEATKSISSKLLKASNSVFSFSRLNIEKELDIINGATEVFSRVSEHLAALSLEGED